MEMKEAQKLSFKLLEEINKKNNIKHDPDSMFLSLVEEVGEVARELSKKQKNWREEFDKEKLSDELADIISRTFIIAQDNDIDMDLAFNAKINKIKQRFNIL
jgi:NTP pyrophosphatase (non-canonical NTP hydrolase)